jgi:hypothetical protein
MGHEKKMVREKDVKFDGEDGSIELTDIRLVWIKKPSRWGSAKKFGALAGAVAGAALLEGVGREMGGIGGRAVRSLGRGMGYAAVGVAISSWTQDSFYNKDKDGNTERMATQRLSQYRFWLLLKLLRVEMISSLIYHQAVICASISSKRRSFLQ